MAYVKELTEKAIKCAEGACAATGTTFKTSIYECPYDDVVINYTLCDMLKEQYEALGLTDIQPVKEAPAGSSDIGSVSYRCPALHGNIKIAEKDVAGHSRELAAATISPEGRQALLNGATALAVLGTELITKPELLAKVKKEFDETIAKQNG